MDELKEKTLSTILEEGVDFIVTVTNPGILHRFGILKKERTFTINPIRLGALMRISKIFIALDSGPVDMAAIANEGDALRAGTENIVKYTDGFAEIAAIAIENSQKQASPWLISFLRENLTASELLRLIGLVVRQMDVSDFLLCVIRTRGIVLMKEKAPETSGKLSAA